MNKQRSTKHTYKTKDRVYILTITIMCTLGLPLFQDTKQEVIRLAKFLEVPHEEELIDEIVHKCSFSNMKTNVPDVSEFGGLTNHFRKGMY